MRRPIRALVIDDDRLICQLLAEYLAPHGYDVVSAHSGPDGAVRALSGEIDVVILDVMLPGMNGFEVLRKIRARSDVPVLMLTARGSEEERIGGLDTGADDYVPKTFSHRELLARINALMRRSKPGLGADIVEAYGISVDAAQRLVRRDGVRIEVTAVEFDILMALMRAAGRVLSRERLLQDASQRGPDVSDRSVDVHISSLRRKLGSSCIETVRSAGYRFCDPEGD
jgi:two-component system response regulator CpxR